MQRKRILFGQPSFDEAEAELVLQTLRSGWIGHGPLVERFESELATYTGASHVVAVNSCTAALHLSLLAGGVGPGDEVITTPFTFVATLNAIEHCGATPVLVDIDPVTLNIEPSAVRRALTARTKAVLPVHFGGRPVDTQGFYDLAEEHDLLIVEDAAHAIGTIDRGRRIGNPGVRKAAVCFSFYPNKNLASAEGGAVCTHDPEMAEQVRLLRMHGLRSNAWLRHKTTSYSPSLAVAAGYKANWTDLQAAIALPQLAKLETFLGQRAELARCYDEALNGVPSVTPVGWDVGDAHSRHALHLYQVRVPAHVRSHVIESMHRDGIGVAVHYIGVDEHPYYEGDFTEQFPHSAVAGQENVSLPIHPALTPEDVQYVVDRLSHAVNGSQRLAA